MDLLTPRDDARERRAALIGDRGAGPVFTKPFDAASYMDNAYKTMPSELFEQPTAMHQHLQDEIATLPRAVDANLDERGQPGSHWVCRYDGLWHDPLGTGGRKQRAAFVRRVGSQWTDDDAEQTRREDNCGQRCLRVSQSGWNSAVAGA